MKIKYDPKVDVTRREFKPVSVCCKQLDNDVILDLGPDDEIWDIEILGVSKRLFEKSDKPELPVENIKVSA
jgi:uncharacterized protein YuzE